MSKIMKPEFTGRNVPLEEIAPVIGISVEELRECIFCAVFGFGIVVSKRRNEDAKIYCSDKMVWEEIGYFNPDFSLRKKKGKGNI